MYWSHNSLRSFKFMDKAERVCEFLRLQTDAIPLIGIICGSGLGKIADEIQDKIIIEYENIKEFPICQVAGHCGNFVIGKLEGKNVIVMQGRFHFYEGHDINLTTLPVLVMKLLGIQYLFVTNAAGGINSKFSIGDFVILKDHINLMGMTGINPLIGANNDKLGPRFPALSGAYDKRLRQIALGVASEMKLSENVHEGIYLFSSGPCYETPAELRMMKLLGADVVGMSTIPEVISARHAGITIFAMSLVTNMVILDEDSDKMANHEEVLKTGQLRAFVFVDFLKRIIKSL